jgi:hypothetical protein
MKVLQLLAAVPVREARAKQRALRRAWPAFAFGQGGAADQLEPSQLEPSPPPPPSPPPHDDARNTLRRGGARPGTARIQSSAPDVSAGDIERSAPNFLLGEACAAARRFRLDAGRGLSPQGPPVPDLSPCMLQPHLHTGHSGR